MRRQWSMVGGPWSVAGGGVGARAERSDREHAFDATHAGGGTRKIERGARGEGSLTASKAWHPRGFSLVEVLLAIFILGIGMIMVASVFPVGANWTRQTTEESNAQTVVQNALSVLQVHYGPSGDFHRWMAPNFLNPDLTANTFNGNSVLKAAGAGRTPFILQAFPNFAFIPPTERAYQFGSATPFPARDATVCTYFWTALVRLNPAHRGGVAATNYIQLSASYNYDVYILVFRKGAVEQRFSTFASEVPNTRDLADPKSALIPSVGYAGWSRGSYDASQSPSVVNAVPPIGQYGIGAYSGTVFRQVLDPTPPNAYKAAMPRPMIVVGTSPPSPMNLEPGEREPVIVSPPPDGAGVSASPLIYVYQTTMSF
jgi:prepilin-type N-terminal cleavage/methylation domain-containing protein